MSRYEDLLGCARETPHRWLVTGGAGFIGSNIVQRLLELGQHVIVLDNFSTGRQDNLDEALAAASGRGTFELLRGDITSPETCRAAAAGATYVLHQAAIGSVPQSIEDPVGVNACNVDGFINVLTAARDVGVRRVVYASSCAVYGDDDAASKQERRVGAALSPYAVTKFVDELYAAIYERTYGIGTVGLRYFNVFGPRQDPAGPYAAVIPLWIQALLAGAAPRIFGDGETTRDFIYVQDVVQANLLAALAEGPAVTGRAYNIGSRVATSLTALAALIRAAVAPLVPAATTITPAYEPFRDGDIRHSAADIALAAEHLGFDPYFTVELGLADAVRWYVTHLGPALTAGDAAASTSS